MATKINHLAIVSNNYTLEARFYDALFGMKSSAEDSAE